MLNKVLDAIASYAQKNPAVISWLLTVGSAAAAKWGLHLDSAQIGSVVAVVMTLAHGWLHTQTRAIQLNVQPGPDGPGEHELPS